MRKICNFCKIEKDISDFYKSQGGRYRTDCNHCVSAKKKEKWKNRSDQKKLIDSERQKDWFKNNPEKTKEYSKKSREKETTKERQKKYYLNNKEDLQKYRKEKYLEKRESNDFKIRVRANNQNFRFKNIDGCRISKVELFDKFNSQNSRCFYCDTELDLSIKNFCHIDHKIPLVKGGSNTIDNIVWCCSNCNLKKGIKLAT